MKPRHDIYQTVTDQLVVAIEVGAGPWRHVEGENHCVGRA